MKEKEKNNVKHNIKNIKHTTRKKSLQKKHEHKLSSFEKENHPEMDIKSIKDIKEKIDSDFPENDDRIYSDNYGTSDYQNEINAASKVNIGMVNVEKDRHDMKKETTEGSNEEVHDLKYFLKNEEKVKDIHRYEADSKKNCIFFPNLKDLLHITPAFTDYKEMLTGDSLNTVSNFNTERTITPFLLHKDTGNLFNYYSDDNYISDFEYWYWELFYDPVINSLILKYNNFIIDEQDVCSLAIKLPEDMLKSGKESDSIFNWIHSLDSSYMSEQEEIFQGNWKISIGTFLVKSVPESEIPVSQSEPVSESETEETFKMKAEPGIMIQITDTAGKVKFKKYIPEFDSTPVLNIISEALNTADERNHKEKGSFIRDFQLYDLFIRREKFETDVKLRGIKDEIKVSDNIFPAFENAAVPMCINYHLDVMHVNEIRIKVFNGEGTILLNSRLKQNICPFDCENDSQIDSCQISYPKYDSLKYFINMFDWTIVFDKTFNIFLLKAVTCANSIDGDTMYFPVSGFKDAGDLMDYLVNIVYIFMKYVGKHKKSLKAEWYEGWEEILKGSIKKKTSENSSKQSIDFEDADKVQSELLNIMNNSEGNNLEKNKLTELKCFQLNENINNIRTALIYLVKKCDIGIVHFHASSSYEYVLKVMGKEYQFKDFIGKADYMHYMELFESAIKKSFTIFYGYDLSKIMKNMKWNVPFMACSYLTDNPQIFGIHKNYDYITEFHAKNILRYETEHFYVQFDFIHQKMLISDNWISDNSKNIQNIRKIYLSTQLKSNMETELWMYFYTTIFPCFCFTGQIHNEYVMEIRYDEKEHVYRGNLKGNNNKSDVGLPILNFSQVRKIKRMISSIMNPNALLPYPHIVEKDDMIIDSNWKLLHNYKDEYYIMIYLESEHDKLKYKRTLVGFSDEDKKSIENFMRRLNSKTMSGMFTKYPLTEEYKWHYEKIYVNNDYINPYDEWSIRYSSKDASYVAELYGSIFPIEETDESRIMNIVQKYIRKELDGRYNFIY